MPDSETFTIEVTWGKWLRHRREELGLSVQNVLDQLAELGVASSRMTLYRAEYECRATDAVRDALNELLAETER